MHGISQEPQVQLVGWKGPGWEKGPRLPPKGWGAQLPTAQWMRALTWVWMHVSYCLLGCASAFVCFYIWRDPVKKKTSQRGTLKDSTGRECACARSPLCPVWLQPVWGALEKVCADGLAGGGAYLQLPTYPSPSDWQGCLKLTTSPISQRCCSKGTKIQVKASEQYRPHCGSILRNGCNAREANSGMCWDHHTTLGWFNHDPPWNLKWFPFRNFRCQIEARSAFSLWAV